MFKIMPGEHTERRHYFLTDEEVRFFECLSSIVVPSGTDHVSEPGASEVGTVNYIDSSLYSFPKEVQEYFRGSVGVVNSSSKRLFNKEFCELSDSDKNTVLHNLFLNPTTRERAFALRSVAIEGVYSDYHDPWYNGVSGWEVVGFGGKRISDIKKDWSFLHVWKDWLEHSSKRD